MNDQAGDGNILVKNIGLNPLVNFNFMLRVEGFMDVPCKSVSAFTKENEFEYIKEGGLNDYVHLKRKQVTKPFTFTVERYVGIDYYDPLPLGAELVLPVLLFVSRYGNNFEVVERAYTFTGCTVMSKEYGRLDAEKSGLLTENVTIAYRELLVVDTPGDVNMLEDYEFSDDKTEPFKAIYNKNETRKNDMAKKYKYRAGFKFDADHKEVRGMQTILTPEQNTSFAKKYADEEQNKAEKDRIAKALANPSDFDAEYVFADPGTPVRSMEKMRGYSPKSKAKMMEAAKTYNTYKFSAAGTYRQDKNPKDSSEQLPAGAVEGHALYNKNEIRKNKMDTATFAQNKKLYSKYTFAGDEKRGLQTILGDKVLQNTSLAKNPNDQKETAAIANALANPKTYKAEFKFKKPAAAIRGMQIIHSTQRSFSQDMKDEEVDLAQKNQGAFKDKTYKASYKFDKNLVRAMFKQKERTTETLEAAKARAKDNLFAFSDKPQALKGMQKIFPNRTNAGKSEDKSTDQSGTGKTPKNYKAEYKFDKTAVRGMEFARGRTHTTEKEMSAKARKYEWTKDNKTANTKNSSAAHNTKEVRKTAMPRTEYVFSGDDGKGNTTNTRAKVLAKNKLKAKIRKPAKLTKKTRFIIPAEGDNSGAKGGVKGNAVVNAAEVRAQNMPKDASFVDIYEFAGDKGKANNKRLRSTPAPHEKERSEARIWQPVKKK